MARRRLTAIAGALGLVAWLVSSGVTAQADTPPGPDLTYYSLLATYSWSNQDVCFSNGAPPVSTTPCVIVQPTPAPGKRNIAVCVQSSNAALADQQCDITQTNDTHNNYALVIQRIQQSACAPVTCQTGTQRASIGQANPLSSGSNFAGVFQTINQSIGEREDDPTQTNSQHVQVKPPSTGSGLSQLSGTGSNFAAVGQFSQQSQTGSTAQTQIADQVAGSSGFGNGIKQTTMAPGANAAILGQVQKQGLQTQALTSQTQHAFQDGDITQDDGLAKQNFASGHQFQNQREQGVSVGTSKTVQHQLGGPKCCSFQNGGRFDVTIQTDQFANLIPPANQTEDLQGNCDSVPNGCDVTLSATQQGQPTTIQCTGSFCHPTISCIEGFPCVASQGGG